MNTGIRFRVKGLGVWVVPHSNNGESNGKEHGKLMETGIMLGCMVQI